MTVTTFLDKLERGTIKKITKKTTTTTTNTDTVF